MHITQTQFGQSSLAELLLQVMLHKLKLDLVSRITRTKGGGGGSDKHKRGGGGYL